MIQAEDEIASIGMVIGAGWAGARAMTSTSGPGISLMGEFAGLAYYAEVPGVVFDIQRVGPSTGLPTRTAQGDILSTALLSHGDTKQIMLIPASVEECYTMSMEAFDFAERFQSLVFVMSDLDLAMNTWMSTHVRISGTAGSIAARCSTPRPWRGSAAGAATRTWTATASRIARSRATTCPRISLADRATTKTASTASGRTTTSTTWIACCASSRPRGSTCPSRSWSTMRGREIGVIGYGTSHWAIEESRGQLEREFGVHDRLPAAARLSVHRRSSTQFIDRYSRIYLVEQNRDAQMLGLMRLDCTPERVAKIRSVLHYSGLPIDARSVTDAHRGAGRTQGPAQRRDALVSAGDGRRRGPTSTS